MSNYRMPSIVELAEVGCDVCKEFMRVINEPATDDPQIHSTRMLKACELQEKHMKTQHKERVAKQFAFTLTTNSDDRASAQSQLCFAVLRLFEQRTNPIAQGGAWLEYTEAGRPHIHGWYETKDGGRVFAKTFARCWPLWKEKRGLTRFGGGYHEEMKTNRYLAYASAEGREVIRKNLNEPFIFNEKAERLEPTA